MLILAAGAETRSLKDLLVLILANALYYNAPLALAALKHHNAIGELFGYWFGMIFQRKKSNDKAPHHFRRAQDKKVRSCLIPVATIANQPMSQHQIKRDA